MLCTGYEMVRYKGTQASHLYEKSMHTLCTIRYMCKVIAEPVPCDKRGCVKLNDRDLSEYLNEVDFLAKRAESIRREEREEAAAKKSAEKKKSLLCEILICG